MTEIHADLAFAYKRIGKGWENLAGLLQAQVSSSRFRIQHKVAHALDVKAASDNIVLSDSFNYQAANAKAAKVRPVGCSLCKQLTLLPSGHTQLPHANYAKRTRRFQSGHHKAEKC